MRGILKIPFLTTSILPFAFPSKVVFEALSMKGLVKISQNCEQTPCEKMDIPLASLAGQPQSCGPHDKISMLSAEQNQVSLARRDLATSGKFRNLLRKDTMPPRIRGVAVQAISYFQQQV